MTTLNLEQAAAYLHMHRVTLLIKAQAGQIPAAKPAKRWVFIEHDLIEYLRSLYPAQKIKASEPKSTLQVALSLGFERSYYQLLGMSDCPQIHSPKPDPRSGERHADGANRVAKGEAVGLVVKSGNMPQSKARVMRVHKD